MTFDYLAELLIEKAGLYARANRKNSIRILTAAIKVWEDQPYEPGMKKAVRRTLRLDYGVDPFTLFLLGILINTLIRLLLEWWFDDRLERGRMLWKFRRELEGNGGWKSGDH